MNNNILCNYNNSNKKQGKAMISVKSKKGNGEMGRATPNY